MILALATGRHTRNGVVKHLLDVVIDLAELSGSARSIEPVPERVVRAPLSELDSATLNSDVVPLVVASLLRHLLFNVFRDLFGSHVTNFLIFDFSNSLALLFFAYHCFLIV